MALLNVILDGDQEYVGFWSRVWASVIDTIVLLIVVGVLLMIFGRQESLAALPTQGSLTDVFLNYLLPFVAVIALWVRYGATPGKQVIHARIVDATTGQPLRLGQSVVRYFGYFVSCIPLFAGFIWIAFDRRKQGWHDKMANTVVVRPRVTEIVSVLPSAQ